VKKGRKLLVHPRFQIRASLIVGVIILLLSAGASFFLYQVSMRSNARLSDVVALQKKCENTQAEFYTSLLYLSQKKDSNYRISARQVETDMAENAASVRRITREIETIRTTNGRLTYAALIFTMIQLIVLVWLILKQTSRVSGQMKLLNRYFDRLLDGEKPVIRKLRDGDHFHEVFDKLELYVQRLREHEGNKG
jgi:methyl-accepting chemotaxis protein